MRRTLERSQRTRQKPNRWSWGGALHTNTPSTPAGTFTHHTPTHTQYLQKLTALSPCWDALSCSRVSPLFWEFVLVCLSHFSSWKHQGFQVNLNTFEISSPWCLTVCRFCKYVCLPLRVSIVLPCLYLNFSDPLPSVVTADSHPALPLPPLSLSPFFSNSLIVSLSLSYPRSGISLCLLSPLCSLFLFHCPFPSWSRFCRVGFPLSTRPCWTGAHAECFQSLPQIRNDLPMWIL